MEGYRFSQKTDLIWLIGTSIGIAMTLFGAFVTPYPTYKVGHCLVYAMIMARLIMYPVVFQYENFKIFKPLFIMGLVTGFVELVADYWLINGITTGRLVYFSGPNRPDVMLLNSPFWMPFAWALMTTEYGYLVLRLANLLKKPWLATLIGALTAGVGIGFYEYLAYANGWWYYEPARVMIGKYCAVYIPVGEFLLFLTFYTIFKKTHAIKNTLNQALIAGTIFGLTIFVVYGISYYLLEVL